MLYTADAMAVLAYLADKLPENAERIFRMAEDDEAKIQVPSIAVGEVLYTISKGKDVFGVEVPIEKISLILDVLEYSKNMFIADLSPSGWRKALELKLPELHDRMIVATHLTTDSEALITDDDEIQKVTKTIW